MEIEAAEFTRGESSSAASESKGKGIEVTRGESSSAESQSNVESNLQIDISQLHDVREMGAGSNNRVRQGIYMGNPVLIKQIMQKDTFLREVELLSKVQHDNIVKFIGYSQNQTIVTELMGGGSLKKHLSSIPLPGTLDEKDALTFALGISRAMEYLHGKGIIHSHLKTSNIFLTEDKKTVKVGLFGLRREDVEGTMTPEVVEDSGLPKLLKIQAHEVSKWRPKHSQKADVYRFSFVLWVMLTNITPFQGRLAPETQERVAAHIRPLVTSCWEPDPNERPEFSEISESLEELLRNPTGEILPVTESPPRADNDDDDDDDIEMMFSIGRRNGVFTEAQIDYLTNVLNGTPVSSPRKTITSLAKKIGKTLRGLAGCVDKKAE